MLIVRDEIPVGIACESDCEGVDPETPIDRVMSSPVHTIGAAASVGDARSLMNRLDVGVLPVIAGDVLVGLVTRADLEAESAVVV